ncbi:hypothetical protein D3C74_278240 [compost metagenome]
MFKSAQRRLLDFLQVVKERLTGSRITADGQGIDEHPDQRLNVAVISSRNRRTHHHVFLPCIFMQ